MPHTRPRNRRRRRLFGAQVALFCGLVGALTLLSAVGLVGGRAAPDIGGLRGSARLLGADDDGAAANAGADDDPAQDFPADALLSRPYDEADNKWAIVLHVVGIVHMFAGLGIVCDDCFVPALEVMVERFGITEDVAGATFMAAGGSAPELFTSIMGVFVAESDVGFGTIVGSAVFNVLFVIGLCAVFAGNELKLTWWPLFRDCSYYIFGLLSLSAIVYDQKVEGWEAVVLFLEYIGYVVVMKYNARLHKFVAGLRRGGAKAQQAEDAAADAVAEASAIFRIRDIRGAVLRNALHGNAHLDEESKNRIDVLKSSTGVDKFRAAARFLAHQSSAKVAVVAADTPVEPEDDEEEEDDGGRFDWPEGRLAQAAFVFTLPLVAATAATVPDCSKPKWRNWYPVTFFMSIVWIAVFAYLMVWYATILGIVLNISSVIMGLTLLAAGTSVPDALSSIIVARDGYGDMAVSSSIGSNVFDILVGLPVPWILKTLVVDPGSSVPIISDYLFINTATLMAMVFLVVVSINHVGWVLSKTLGKIMFVGYVLFVVESVLLESLQP